MYRLSPRITRLLRVSAVYLTGTYLIGLTVYLLLRLVMGDRLWWLGFLNNLTPLYFLPLVVLLPLALLVRSRVWVARLLPFALVGGLWFGPYFLPRSTVNAGGNSLQVVTFNIWGLNPRMADAAAWIQRMDADVVLLQEVLPDYPRNDWLADVYPYRFWDAAGGEGWANYTLSRFPILATETLAWYENEAPSLQRIVLDVAGQPVAVYNAHLLMPLGDTPHLAVPINQPFLNMALQYDDSARNAQIRGLLARLAAEPYPYIVAGDFNMSDQTAIYGELAGMMTDSFREAGWGFGWSWPVGVSEDFSTPLPPLFRLDYIWHSPAFRALHAEQGPPLGSDHLPLAARLAWVKR